ATSVSPGFAWQVAGVFRARYESVALPVAFRFKTTEDLRKALITLYLLKNFKAVDASYPRYEEYRRAFAALPVDLLIRLSNTFTLSDARWLTVFYSETATRDSKTATAL